MNSLERHEGMTDLSTLAILFECAAAGVAILALAVTFTGKLRRAGWIAAAALWLFWIGREISTEKAQTTAADKGVGYVLTHRSWGYRRAAPLFGLVISGYCLVRAACESK